MANEKAYESTGITLTIGSLSPCYISISGIGFADPGKIENTCLNNTEYKTFQPPKLKEIADIAFTAFQKEDDFDDIEAEIQDNQEITITMTGVGSIVFYGYLASWDVAETGVGEPRTASGSIVVTNVTDAGVETAPSYSAA